VSGRPRSCPHAPGHLAAAAETGGKGGYPLGPAQPDSLPRTASALASLSGLPYFCRQGLDKQYRISQLLSFGIAVAGYPSLGN